MSFTNIQKLKLYKNILRIHQKKLSYQLKLLGDQYVRNEWKLHKNLSNPLLINQFISKWNEYFNILQSQSIENNNVIGIELKEEQILSLNKDQKETLELLKNEVKNSLKE
jgi:hypothetical protein